MYAHICVCVLLAPIIHQNMKTGAWNFGNNFRKILGPWQCRQYRNSRWAGWSRDRIPMGMRFSTLVQTSPGVNQPPIQWFPGHSWGWSSRGVALTTLPQSSAEVKERVELYLYSPSGPSWPVLEWNFPLHWGKFKGMLLIPTFFLLNDLWI